MLIQRKCHWGRLLYDTQAHRFRCLPDVDTGALPHAAEPVVLNVYLTLKCNMACTHCVSRDMSRYGDRALEVSSELVKNINTSPFLVVVITGGEPLLPEFEKPLLALIRGLRSKAIVLDSNGTIHPSPQLVKALVRRNVLLRISLDSARPQDEICLRRTRGPAAESTEIYLRKLELVSRLAGQGVHIGAQSVLHRNNMKSILGLAEKLHALGVRRWWVQRLVPTVLSAGYDCRKYIIEPRDHRHARLASEIRRVAAKAGIYCFWKGDLRDNCVFLLAGDGDIYTQPEKPGRKILVGKLGRIDDFFTYVSRADHCARYYALNDSTRGGARS